MPLSQYLCIDQLLVLSARIDPGNARPSGIDTRGRGRERLVRIDRHTECPLKGRALHSLQEPCDEMLAIKGHLAFIQTSKSDLIVIPE